MYRRYYVIRDNAANPPYAGKPWLMSLGSHGIVIGKTGSGKSNYLLHILKHIDREDCNIVLLDPHGQTAEITATSSHFAPIYIIHSHGTTSDIGEPTQVSYPLNGVNYTSVIFNNGFNPSTWSDTSPSMTVGGGAGATFTTSGQTMNSVGFSISAVISGSTDVLSGTLTGVTSGIWDWWTFSYHYYGFTYTFPNLGVGTYELQALAGGSSEGVGYAFNYVS
ncbi:MAG: hypothetical protein AMDU1_APLC00004G0063 [Thermoplasmatales archaeon A-plasma]|nr:MAG: hypothetical protein AMDU1_APLC00004G0063 [Thermoplasmatales archaeon A-plasma]